MPLGPESASIEDLMQIAAELHVPLGLEEAKDYQAMADATSKLYARLDVLPERKLPVKYPRTTGYRPPAEENPLNGWYWRCDVKGAPQGILKGQRVALKDVVCLAGVPMMNGSRLLEGYVPDIDATIVTRLLDAGANIVGKANCEDFSFSGGGHTCSYGPVGNPFKPDHNPGASSNGSAALLGAGEVDLAIGGDQGGSIRIPASWSGCYGLKPTYGLVPYTGCAMIEMTVDHIGPMANSTEGIAKLMSAIAGFDPLDPRQYGRVSPEFKPDYMPALGRGVRGMKIGVVREGFKQDGRELGLLSSEAEVDERVKGAIAQLRSLGAEVEEISIPYHLDAYPIWSAIALEGAAAFMLRGYGAGTNWQGYYNTGLAEALARGFKAHAHDLAATVKSVLLRGEYFRKFYNGRYYNKAQNLRHLVSEAYDKALERFDVLAMPTTPARATKMVDRYASVNDTVSSALSMLRNTVTADLTGHPSISIPCGIHDGLPIGLMLTAGQLKDDVLISASAAFEKIGDWKRM